MKFERERLICFLVGLYTGKNPNVTASDLVILIDQHLINSNQPGLDKTDTVLLEELVAETMYLAMSKHGYINRQQRRQHKI